MSKQLKLRRGTTAQHSTFTGASGEVTVDTTKKTLVVHDGVTAGGVPMVTLTGAETLTNKTLTNPTINGFTGSTAAINIGSGQLVKDTAGNLGIGTSSPNFKAHISTGSAASITQPTAGSYGLYVQQNTSGSTGGIYIQDGASNSGNSLFIADNNGVGRFVVNGDGNVGIGQSSPGAMLHITKNTTANTRNLLLQLNDGNWYPSGNPTINIGGWSGGGNYVSGDIGFNTNSNVGMTFSVSDFAGGTPIQAMLIDTNRNFQTYCQGTSAGMKPAYTARAWVNFNGTGTVAIRAGGNVSSITDNGTGDYTVNFSTAMSDANYGIKGNSGDGTNASQMLILGANTNYSTGSCRIRTGSAGAYADNQYVNVSILR